MNKLINKKKFLLLISLIVSAFIIAISQNKIFWDWIFGSLAMVPPQWPSFSDFNAINQALKSLKDGYNPYFYNPHDTHGVLYVYPKIWLIIFDVLHFQKKEIYLFICFLILTFYFFILLNFFSLFKKNYSYIFLIFFFTSPTNTLLIERLNTDIIIFILTYFLVINNNFIIKNFFFFTSVALKIYPVFLIVIFLNNKKIFFTITFSFILIYALYEEILLGSKNMIEYALIFAYGSRTFANAIFRVFGNYNIFLNQENYEYLKFFLILFFIIISLIFFLKGLKERENYNKNISDFFIIGSSVYLGTFIFTSNIDYRLVFLIYTFPLIFLNIKEHFAKLFFISCFISFYSLWFQSSDYKSATFMLMAIFIYMLKFFIFVYLSYKLGAVLGGYKIIKVIKRYISRESRIFLFFKKK